MHTHELELRVLTELSIELYTLANTVSQEKNIGNKIVFLEKGLEQIRYTLDTIEMLHSN